MRSPYYSCSQLFAVKSLPVVEFISKAKFCFCISKPPCSLLSLKRKEKTPSKYLKLKPPINFLVLLQKLDKHLFLCSEATRTKYDNCKQILTPTSITICLTGPTCFFVVLPLFLVLYSVYSLLFKGKKFFWYESLCHWPSAMTPLQIQANAANVCQQIF